MFGGIKAFTGALLMRRGAQRMSTQQSKMLSLISHNMRAAALCQNQYRFYSIDNTNSNKQEEKISIKINLQTGEVVEEGREQETKTKAATP